MTGGSAPAEQDGRNVDEVLAEAVRVLTMAGRTGRDWAEFVTLAVTGAAANLGGIEPSLAGRPGSWEADLVRTLLLSAGGSDGSLLLQHRTEPVVVTVHVELLLLDLGLWRAYDDAQAELVRRYDSLGIPTANTADGAVQLPAATDEQEAQAQRIGELEDRLEDQRQKDWADYGHALAANVQAAAGRREGLRAPVTVHIDLDSFPTCGTAQEDLAEDLLQEAIQATPLPGDGRTPLERLEQP